MTTLQTAGEYMEALAGARDLIAAQAVEIEQLRKDAGRYRWLRKMHDKKDYQILWHVRDDTGSPIAFNLLDTTIDAAITKELT